MGQKTVDVTLLNDYPALLMTWEQDINKADLKSAFQYITDALDQSETALYVVVDLSHNPRMPVVDTMKEALRGAFRHPKLKEWLVLGMNREAMWIANLLTQTTRRNNIQWFDTMDDVQVYLKNTAV